MKRIAIITYHKAYNCGAMLQAWALQKFLISRGCVAEFPTCNNVGRGSRWIVLPAVREARGLAKIRLFLSQFVLNVLTLGWDDYNRYAYNRFCRHYLHERKCLPSEMDKHFDVAVVGSDQVWQPLISREDTPLFLSENLPASLPVISYAASFGDTVPVGPMLDRLLTALPRFKAISVRESLAQGEIQKRGLQAELVLDPTFLLQKSDYETLIGKRPLRKRYLFLYAVSLSDFVLRSARDVAARLELQLVICGVYVHTRYHAPSECLWGVSPEKMVTLIAHADVVMASSFHGTALPIILEKPFLSVHDSRGRPPTRIMTLLSQLGLSERLAGLDASVDQMVKALASPIDWNSVRDKLSDSRSGSVSFLERGLGL